MGGVQVALTIVHVDVAFQGIYVSHSVKKHETTERSDCHSGRSAIAAAWDVACGFSSCSILLDTSIYLLFLLEKAYSEAVAAGQG
jgi:hypothetical protein